MEERRERMDAGEGEAVALREALAGGVASPSDEPLEPSMALWA